MKTSKISQETSRIVRATSAARRSTRSTTSQLDIEDAVPPLKRQKRETTPRTPIKRSPGRSITVKQEVEESCITSSPRKIRKPVGQVKNGRPGKAKDHHPPRGWEEMYALVKQMRLQGPAQNAAVDTMGCARLAQEHASPRVRRYQTLTALMLSSQTKDTTNALAMQRLYNELPPYEEGAPGGLNLENILAVDATLLNELIWSVGFHNNKTKYIKAAAEILRDGWARDVPDTIEGLISLPGVGPKMAYLCLSSAWGKTEGIGIDVHVHRITNLWGWHKTTTPEETRLTLQAWLPRELWYEINWLLVGFGQTVCPSVGRKCGECVLGLTGVCRSADRAKVKAGKGAWEEQMAKDESVPGQLENIKGDIEHESVPGKLESIKVEKDIQDMPIKAEA